MINPRRRKVAMRRNSMEPGSVAEFGAIFMSSFRTRQECFERQLFGLPPSFIEFVKGIKKGMLLFLFEYENRKLYGVFEATSDGGVDIIPDAYRSSGRFPAQVRFRVFWRCGPLSEYEFCDAIKENYYAAYKFRFGLSKIQIHRLLELFATNGIRPRGLPKFKKNLSTPSDKGNSDISFERYCPDKDDNLDVESETEISEGGPLSGEILSLGSVVVPSPKEKEKKDTSSSCVDFLGHEDFIPLTHSPERESSDQPLDIPSVDHLGVKALYSDMFDSQVDVFSRLKMEVEGGAVDAQRTRVQRKGKELKVWKRKRRHDNPENGDKSQKWRHSVFTRLKFTSEAPGKEKKTDVNESEIENRSIVNKNYDDGLKGDMVLVEQYCSNYGSDAVVRYLDIVASEYKRRLTECDLDDVKKANGSGEQNCASFETSIRGGAVNEVKSCSAKTRYHSCLPSKVEFLSNR